ncbi:MAG: hypothetical protein ACKO96_17920, partial [Flammeovirgaceae bacterium]
LDLTVHLSAPMILAPEDLFDINKPIGVVDTGTITLENTLLKGDLLKRYDFKSVKKAVELYDRYEAGFKDF